MSKSSAKTASHQDSPFLNGTALGDEIVNHITGQKIRFLKNSIDTLEMQSVYPSFSEEPPMHFHPNQQEYFEVLEGELTVRYKDRIKVYEQGSHLYLPSKKAHAMWNSGFVPTKVNWKVTPPLNTEQLLRETFKLVNEGKTDHAGKPSILALVYLLKKYNATFRLVSPKFMVITLLWILFSPIYYFSNDRKR